MRQPPLQPERVHGVGKCQPSVHSLLGCGAQGVVDLLFDHDVLSLADTEPLLARTVPRSVSHLIEIIRLYGSADKPYARIGSAPTL
jgi:hypothetical protein